MKILYFMHVDWNWIKQRPHFIVEGLAENGYQVDVFYPIARNRKVLADNTSIHRGVKLLPYYRAPYAIRNYSWLNKLSNITTKLQFPSDDYDVIFLTYPEQIELIPKNFKGKVIYDCMDDHSAFDGVNKELLVSLEKRVIDRSFRILVSSGNLKDKIMNYTSKPSDSFILLRNGLGTQLNLDDIKKGKSFNRKAVYLGTISEWIDFELLVDVLDRAHKDVSIDFIGPVTFNVPKHPKINFLGPIDSGQIKAALEPYGIFIMPFVVNDLIRSVDPVKFYEYIHLGGNIVSCRYPEIDRFDLFVNFYQHADELLYLLDKIDDTSVTSIETRRSFLTDNTWEQRVKKIVEILEKNNE